MPPGRPITLRTESVGRGDVVAPLVRAAISTGLAKLDGTTPFAKARAWADADRVEMVLRAATSPTSTTNAAALTQITTAFLDLLTAASAGAALFARAIKLNFNRAASIALPGIGVGTADFVAESAPIPVIKGATTSSSLTPHKIAAITSASGELLRNPSAEDLLRAMLVEAVAPAIDKNLFSANAGDGTRPAGLFYNVAPIAPSTGGTGANKTDALVDDMAAIAKALAPVGGDGNIVLIAAPAQAVAVRMRLFTEPWPVLVSAALADKTCVGIAVNALVSAVDGAPQVDASREAELHFESSPAEIVTSAGAVATPVGSVFQSDSVALRVKLPVTWGLRDSRGVAWLPDVVW